MRSLFIYINKTGGSSICAALNLPKQHSTARELAKEVGESAWRKSFKFSFVRNPWDKVVSQYHYRVKRDQTLLGSVPVTFPDWVRLTYRDRDERWYDKPKMFLSQFDWLVSENGRMELDFVGRFENMSVDFAALAVHLGAVGDPFPHLNATVRGHYCEYYDSESEEIVRENFASDLVVFGYKF